MPIRRINDLKINVIKQLLREKNLDTTGTKTVLALRLSEAVQNDNIDVPDEDEDNEVDQRFTTMQNQIQSLTAILQQMQQTLIQQNIQANSANNSTNNVIPSGSNNSNNSRQCESSSSLNVNSSNVSNLSNIRQLNDSLNSIDSRYKWCTSRV